MSNIEKPEQAAGQAGQIPVTEIRCSTKFVLSDGDYSLMNPMVKTHHNRYVDLLIETNCLQEEAAVNSGSSGATAIKETIVGKEKPSNSARLNWMRNVPPQGPSLKTERTATICAAKVLIGAPVLHHLETSNDQEFSRQLGEWAAPRTTGLSHARQ